MHTKVRSAWDLSPEDILERSSQTRTHLRSIQPTPDTIQCPVYSCDGIASSCNSNNVEEVLF
eukprot:6042109-Amphidinium_carterae.1